MSKERKRKTEEPRLPRHSHCLNCGEAVPPRKKHCTPGCEREYSRWKKREQMKTVGMILVLLTVLIWFFVSNYFLFPG